MLHRIIAKPRQANQNLPLYQKQNKQISNTKHKTKPTTTKTPPTVIAGVSPTTNMHEPPDIRTYGVRSNNTNLGEPKYITIRRNDNNSFVNISPFIIKKTIDHACDGEVESCKKTRDGSLLIKTKNTLQATKLLKLKLMTTMEITASEHKSLNCTKGVIYCNELRNISEDEILEELKTQKVTEIRKILRKQPSNTEDNNSMLTETGLIIITFATHKLPEQLRIGYEAVRVRPYIPQPLRCRNCLRFGHPTTACKSTEICTVCSNTKHTNENEHCENQKSCLNCKNNPETDHQHSPLDRKCPTFLKQQELTAIKTTEKVDHKTALNIYHSRHGQLIRSSYAKALSTATNHTTITQTPNLQIPTNAALKTTSTTSSLKPSTHTTPSTSTPPTTSAHRSSTNVREEMETDLACTTPKTTASSLSGDLKIRIFSKDKSNNLSTTLKNTKTNIKPKSKTQNNNKHTYNSESDSI